MIPLTLQELVLKHRTFNYTPGSQVTVFEDVVGLALENQALPRLADALFRKAEKIIPYTGLTDLYMRKYRKDLKNYNLILSKIDVNFSLCSNCKAQEGQCLNRQEVTIR